MAFRLNTGRSQYNYYYVITLLLLLLFKKIIIIIILTGDVETSKRLQQEKHMHMTSFFSHERFSLHYHQRHTRKGETRTKTDK